MCHSGDKLDLEEWLFYAEPNIRENYLFLRNGLEIKISKIWNKLSNNRIEQTQLFTKSYHLFLSVLIAQESIPRIGEIEKWLRGNIIIFDFSDKQLAGKATAIMARDDYRGLINKFLSNADLGFISIYDKIRQQAHKNQSIEEDLLNVWYSNELINFELYTVHAMYNEKYENAGTLLFEMLKSESSGTIKYFMYRPLINWTVF